MIKFRTLRADEIECRIGTIVNTDKKSGVSLLLYKDARCDMAMLDEAVTPERWQRRHYDCKGNLFCSVGIKSESGEWIFKDDCGVESNTAAEKGEASDSFKRACVNWGIGRELYTSPFIWVTDCEIDTDRNGKARCKDSFKVSEIEYDEARNIVALEICSNKKTVFSYKKWQAPQSKTHLKCAVCGKEIKEEVSKDGSKTFSPSEVAGRCKGMCKACYEASKNK